MKTLHVKKGDNVIVLSGKDKGKVGKVLACNIEDSRVQVENVCAITRHVKPRSAQSSGGRLPDIGFIHSSNVQIVCPECNKPTRVAKNIVDGVKNRSCKRCHATLDVSKTDKKSKKSSQAKSIDKKSKSKEPKVVDVKAEPIVDKKSKKPTKTDKKTT
jgi:large subunit ribosomal protein L24